MTDIDWQSYDSSVCTLYRAADLVADRWTLLVLRDVFRGIRRFDALQAHLGVARDVLTKRLSALVEAGVLERRAYREPGARSRHEYLLTAAGRDLHLVLTALKDWGEEHLPVDDGPTAALLHRDCGEPVRVETRCAAGHAVGPHDIDVLPERGARRVG